MKQNIANCVCWDLIFVFLRLCEVTRFRACGTAFAFEWQSRIGRSFLAFAIRQTFGPKAELPHDMLDRVRNMRRNLCPSFGDNRSRQLSFLRIETSCLWVF